MTIRGEPAFGRADQSRHNLVFGGSKDPARIGLAFELKFDVFPAYVLQLLDSSLALFNKLRIEITHELPRLCGAISRG